MLVLTRKVNEAVHIGDNILVRIVAINEGQIKLGVEAPPDVKIYRAEIFAAIQEQNVRAIRAEKSSAIKAAELLTGKPGSTKKKERS